MINSFKAGGYVFCKYQDANSTSNPLPYVILRHDVDFSLHTALELASLENQIGIQATYFIHLRSSIYNSISYDGIDILNKISLLGHDLALHITYRDNRDELSKEVVEQIHILKQYCSFLNPGIVSFHRPGVKAKELVEFILPQGIYHTYQKPYFSDISYFSDSGGIWKSGNPVDSEDYKNKKSMQILTHPLWWLEHGETPLQKLTSFLSRNRSVEIDLIQKTVISYPIDSIK